ncbi:MAG: hypothetical protein AAFV80_02055 [Bacteroidota bacterium]
MALLTRRTLKNFFRRGSFPTEVNFSDLIDSTVNKIDDGFAKTPEDGLSLSPQGSSQKLLSFFENVRNKNPEWSFTFSEDKRTKGLSIDNKNGDSALFLRKGGNVGIGTTLPNAALDVNGTIAMKGRIGNYKVGQIPGDGRWHSILSGLDGIQAFEIMAQVSGPSGRGKYALLHATALATYGKSRWKIKRQSAYYGWFWNRLRIRWAGDVHNYRLEVKTGSHYGLDDNQLPRMVNYRITNLWQAPQEVSIIQEEEINL